MSFATAVKLQAIERWAIEQENSIASLVARVEKLEAALTEQAFYANAGGQFPEAQASGLVAADEPTPRAMPHRRYEWHNPRNRNCRYSTSIGVSSPDADWCSCPIPSGA